MSEERRVQRYYSERILLWTIRKKLEKSHDRGIYERSEKMRYVRFMSIEELDEYLRGEKLENHTVWKDRGNKTDSVGFCFFDDSESPEERLKYYSRGITCTTDVWAVFEQIGGEPLKKCTGIYRDPEKDNASIEQKMLEAIMAVRCGVFPDVPTMEVTEYSTTEYSQETLKLVAVGRESHRGIRWLSQAEMEELLPKKPQAVLSVFGGTAYECRNCGDEVQKYLPYCPWCGQMQDWSDVDEP